MKRLVAIVLVATLSTPGCALRLASRRPKRMPGAWMWSNVVSLSPDTPVRVFTLGALHEGTFVAADDDSLHVGVQHGIVVFRADLVLRVDQLKPSTRSRAERALASAAVGSVAMVGVHLLVWEFMCLAFAGRPCWEPPRPRTVAAIAALYGAHGATADDGRIVIVYARP